MLTISRPLVVTVAETATLLGMQRAKVYTLLESNVLDGVKIGGSWRVRIESVESLLGESIPDEFFVGATGITAPPEIQGGPNE